jgi:probable blue pigment (indigoidine) exporter
MSRTTNILITSLAPLFWGLTYITTTELLPQGYPLTVSLLRALPAGLLLLIIVRRLPTGAWWWRVFVLGALNFAVFWWFLFVSAYRLPGGVAATVGALQPLVVIMLSRLVLGSPLKRLAIGAAVAGIIGVALLVLTPRAALDPVGIAAGLAGAVCMAAGTVFTRYWQPPVSPLTFTAWQLTAGGILLLPAALLLEPSLPPLTAANVEGFLYMGLINAALTYLLWFRGIGILGAVTVGPLVLLSPVVAVIVGWIALGQSLSPLQSAGIILVLGSVWAGQRAQRPAASAMGAAQPKPA